METGFETVVGLEVHAQLLLSSKLFSGDSAGFGSEPNTNVSPITLGHPGTLPLLNKKAVELAVRLGLACRCQITRFNYFARKNYFYPDLPKGYQISQHTTPICVGGEVPIRVGTEKKQVQLNRIHLEEDAGKSLHDVADDATCLDFNRAGVALVEIVTEPCLSGGEEAYAYLTELRKMLRYLNVCDGNMEEGSMRCDANISVRPVGDPQLGTKVEVKNLNSIRNVRRAIEHESSRMIAMLRAGEAIVQQTRSFDADNGTTFALRSKEEANDYRYFPDPDLVPFEVSPEMVDAIRKAMPALAEERQQLYINQYQLTEYDARVLTEDRAMADYFEQVIVHHPNFKGAANCLLGPVKSWLNERGLDITELKVTPKQLAELVLLTDSGRISFSTASSQIFPELSKDPARSAADIAAAKGLYQDADEGSVNSWVDEVLQRMPDKVQEYRKGKKGLIGLFVGEVKKVSKGKADPKLTNDILLRKLQS